MGEFEATMKNFEKTNEIEFRLENERVELAGRVIFFRDNGKISFGRLQDQFGRIQFVLKRDENEDLQKAWRKNIRIGDIIQIDGRVWTSSAGEKSVLVDKDLILHRRSVHPFPDKHKGIVDPETRMRKRYLDILLDPEYRKVFEVRSRMISSLRSILEVYDFMEIETPILASQASGAQARPFKTHHNALDADLFLRIAPETYLKRAVVAGFDRVFEIGKNFRNEGIDASHNPEFTSIEWYASYWNYKDNLDFFDGVILPELLDYSLVDGLVDRFKDIPRRLYCEVFKEYTGHNPLQIDPGRVDELFKRNVRPRLKDPVYLLDYPASMCPLAHRSETDPLLAEQWQLIVDGKELVKCYTELTDPVEQRRLLEQQMRYRADGDEEAVALEEDFLSALEYGCPPCSGLGIGIDRVIMMLAGRDRIKDVIMFPTVL